MDISVLCDISQVPCLLRTITDHGAPIPIPLSFLLVLLFCISTVKKIDDNVPLTFNLKGEPLTKRDTLQRVFCFCATLTGISGPLQLGCHTFAMESVI